MVLIVIGDDQVHGVSSLGQSIGSQSVFLAVESRMKGGGSLYVVAAYMTPKPTRGARSGRL